MSLKVHKIYEGPFDAEDEEGVDIYWIDCYVEYDGEFFDTVLSSPDFNAVYDVVRHMKSATIEPFVIGETTNVDTN